MVMTTTAQTLKRQNAVFAGSGGTSGGNRQYGFRPAFLDTQTQAVYLARYRSGQPAPFHLLDGLPDEVVVERDAAGSVAAVKPSIVSGFLLNERFVTREEAADQVAHPVPSKHHSSWDKYAVALALRYWYRVRHSLGASATCLSGGSSTLLVKQERADYERIDG